MTTLTLTQVKAILALLMAFGVPQITVNEVQNILIPPIVTIIKSPPIPLQLQLQPQPAPSVSPSVNPPLSIVVPSSSIPSPTEEQATPKIEIGGERFGNVVTFWWKAVGYKEGLTCKMNGGIDIPQEAEASHTVQSVEPYTLTIVCVGSKTASRGEKSLTK